MHRTLDRHAFESFYRTWPVAVHTHYICSLRRKSFMQKHFTATVLVQHCGTHTDAECAAVGRDDPSHVLDTHVSPQPKFPAKSYIRYTSRCEPFCHDFDRRPIVTPASLRFEPRYLVIGEQPINFRRNHAAKVKNYTYLWSFEKPFFDMDNLKSLRTAVVIVAVIIALEILMLGVMLRPVAAFHLWAALGILALMTAYLVRICFVLLKKLEKDKK